MCKFEISLCCQIIHERLQPALWDAMSVLISHKQKTIVRGLVKSVCSPNLLLQTKVLTMSHSTITNCWNPNTNYDDIGHIFVLYTMHCNYSEHVKFILTCGTRPSCYGIAWFHYSQISNLVVQLNAIPEHVSVLYGVIYHWLSRSSLERLTQTSCHF